MFINKKLHSKIMIKFVEFSLFIFVSKFLFASHFEISNDYDQIFSQINDIVLATIDELFYAIKINKNFTNSKSVAERIRIHKFIQNAAVINYKICKDVNDISKAEPSDKKMEYFVNIIGKITQKVIKNEWGQLKNIKISRKRNKIADGNDDDYIPGKNIIVDFAHFETEYNKGIDTLLTEIVRKNWFAKKSNGKTDQYSKEWEPSKLQPTRRIYDGENTSIQRFPFMASVLIQARFFCAGCILTKYTVITAASCLRQYHAENTVPEGVSITVRVGSDFTGRSGEVISVEELNFHPLFDRESMDNNLAILKLSKRLKFGKKIRKITIDSKAEKLKEDTRDILTLGWGKKSHSDENSINTQPLAYAFTDVYSLEECKNIYSRFYVKDKHFCTGFVTKGSGACNNDIGGPAVVGNLLAGIISFGSPHCGRPDAPTVFTKIGFYAEWISSVVKRIKKEKYMLRKQFGESAPEQTTPAGPRNINEEIDSLAQLIGEMQVAKHINSSMNEILKERLSEVAYGNVHKIQNYIKSKLNGKKNVEAQREGNMAREQVKKERQRGDMSREQGKNERPNTDATGNKSEEEYEDDNSGANQSEQAEGSNNDYSIPITDVKNDDDLLEVVFVKEGTTKIFKRTQNSKVKYMYSN